MTIQPHMSQHELVDAEPIISEFVPISGTEAMDHPRRSEIRQELRQILHLHDRDEWIKDIVFDDDIKWNRLWELVHRHTVGGSVEAAFRTLQDRYERAYPSLVQIQFNPDSAFDYVPGEYLTVHYRHIPRVYSIASSPNRDDVEICVRRVPSGRLSSQLCGDVEPGDRIGIRGPFSGAFVGDEFILREPSQRDIVFLATGTGVAPFKSMIDYVFEEGFNEYNGTKRNVWLFLGASWEDDLPYGPQFRDLADTHENFHYVPTLSRETILADWEGETAYIQQTFVKYLNREAVNTPDVPDDIRPRLGEEPAYDIDARLNPNNVELYACGINAMVYSIVSISESVGIPENMIRGEGYG